MGALLGIADPDSNRQWHRTGVSGQYGCGFQRLARGCVCLDIRRDDRLEHLRGHDLGLCGRLHAQRIDALACFLRIAKLLVQQQQQPELDRF